MTNRFDHMYEPGAFGLCRHCGIDHTRHKPSEPNAYLPLGFDHTAYKPPPKREFGQAELAELIGGMRRMQESAEELIRENADLKKEMKRVVADWMAETKEAASDVTALREENTVLRNERDATVSACATLREENDVLKKQRNETEAYYLARAQESERNMLRENADLKNEIEAWHKRWFELKNVYYKDTARLTEERDTVKTQADWSASVIDEAKETIKEALGEEVDPPSLSVYVHALVKRLDDVTAEAAHNATGIVDEARAVRAEAACVELRSAWDAWWTATRAPNQTPTRVADALWDDLRGTMSSTDVGAGYVSPEEHARALAANAALRAVVEDECLNQAQYGDTWKKGCDVLEATKHTRAPSSPPVDLTSLKAAAEKLIAWWRYHENDEPTPEDRYNFWAVAYDRGGEIKTVGVTVAEMQTLVAELEKLPKDGGP